ncbi:multidrug efflux SMR transporter [Microbacterium sp. H1-D42]|uniref:DMT family transporter n=1 Tax=Microbacterium sp. H1-D42 TaxID=2925844 RepID=UPI001F52DD81|nr:multidrug efflux SMR transporter [Microbacterium sp. H1-D42]UNK69505.1 multidrug efflux SMR transporter [Microbacterium sp. H1-D42]
MSWVWLLLAIGFEVTGTLSLRASDGFRKRVWLIPVVISYVLAFTFLGITLETGMPVGVAYGLWTAIGIVLIAVMARVLWKDPLTRRMIVGIGFIVVGSLLVEMSQH